MTHRTTSGGPDPRRGATGKRVADLETVLERMLQAVSPDGRDRALLDAVARAPGGPGVELWRRVDGTWRPTLGRPGASPPPPRDRVQAYLAGRLGDDLLPSGETVVRAPGAHLALALGGDCSGDLRDGLEALLVVRATLDPDDPDPHGGALPARPLPFE